MNGSEHYGEAEQVLELVARAPANLDEKRALIGVAQVHALLAVAAAGERIAALLETASDDRPV